MPDRLESIRGMVEPVVAPLGLQVYDLVLAGNDVRLIVDRPGGVDIDTLEEVSRRIAPELEALPGLAESYTLEVSSPGLERQLRTPAHFTGAIGSEVSVKAPNADGVMERFRGNLTAVSDTGITVTTETGDRDVRFDVIDQARTVFEWAPAPKPGKGSKPGRTKKEAVA